jgi:hypothetical protein
MVVAVCGIFAAISVGTASAATGSFKAESYPATVESPAASLIFNTTQGKMLCTATTMAGSLASFSSSLSLTPTIKGCQLFGVSVTFTVNGCQARLNVTGESVPFGASTDIVCPVGSPGIVYKPIGWDCTTTLLPQTGLSSVFLTSPGTGATRQVNVGVELKKVKYTEVGSLCDGESGAVQANGSISGTLSLKGYQTVGGVKGAQQGLWVS